MKRMNLIMGVLLVSVVLSACGGSSGEASATVSSEAQAQNPDNIKGSDPSEGEQTEAEKSQADLSIEKQIIFDQDGIVVTVTGISEDELFGPELNLLIENGSAKNITVQSRMAAINGYMISSSMSSDVVAGKKSNDSLTFLRSDLDNCGIDTIANIEFSLHIFDPDTYDALYDSEIIKLTTNLSDSFEQAYDDSGETLYDEGGVKIVFKKLNTDDNIFGPEVVLYTENNTEQTITIQVRDTSVNGFMINPSLSTEMTPGNKAVSGISFMASELEENQITDFETIETSFHIFDDNFGTIADTEPVTITIK